MAKLQTRPTPWVPVTKWRFYRPLVEDVDG